MVGSTRAEANLAKPSDSVPQPPAILQMKDETPPAHAATRPHHTPRLRIWFTCSLARIAQRLLRITAIMLHACGMFVTPQHCHTHEHLDPRVQADANSVPPRFSPTSVSACEVSGFPAFRIATHVNKCTHVKMNICQRIHMNMLFFLSPA